MITKLEIGDEVRVNNPESRYDQYVGKVAKLDKPGSVALVELGPIQQWFLIEWLIPTEDRESDTDKTKPSHVYVIEYIYDRDPVDRRGFSDEGEAKRVFERIRKEKYDLGELKTKGSENCFWDGGKQEWRLYTVEIDR